MIPVHRGGSWYGEAGERRLARAGAAVVRIAEASDMEASVAKKLELSGQGRKVFTAGPVRKAGVQAAVAAALRELAKDEHSPSTTMPGTWTSHDLRDLADAIEAAMQ